MGVNRSRDDRSKLFTTGQGDCSSVENEEFMDIDYVIYGDLFKRGFCRCGLLGDCKWREFVCLCV